jgi:hypothetical protein
MNARRKKRRKRPKMARLRSLGCPWEKTESPTCLRCHWLNNYSGKEKKMSDRPKKKKMQLKRMLVVMVNHTKKNLISAKCH